MPHSSGRHSSSPEHERRPHGSAHEEQRRAAASPERSLHPESPAMSTAADLPPQTHARSRTGGSRSEANRWKTVRPWQPPAQEEETPASSSSHGSPLEGEDDGALSLEVIDVSSTAIALGIFGLQSHAGEGSSTPAISIRLNNASWPHVFHSPSSDDDDAPNDRETVVVYGLEPGHEYNVELAVVGMRGSAGIPFTTPAASSTDASADVEAEPEDAPPPYTPSPMPAQLDIAPTAPIPTEASLRAQIKKLRADAKAAETALHGSISSLQRALERTAKDDQKTKQRLIQLDDGAKKLKDAAARDHAEAEEALVELPDLEKTAAEKQQQVSARRAEVLQREKEVLEQVRVDEETIANLTRQLEELKERTDGVKQESDRYEKEVIDDLTARLAHLDHQLQSGEVSPSFLAGATGGGARAGLKTSSGPRMGRDRKGSNAAAKNPHQGKTTPPTTSAPQQRVIPGWKNPNEKIVTVAPSSVAPIAAAPITPPLLSNPQHGPIAPPQPQLSPKEEKVEEKSGWRGLESFARVTARSGK